MSHVRPHAGGGRLSTKIDARSWARLFGTFNKKDRYSGTPAQDAALVSTNHGWVIDMLVAFVTAMSPGFYYLADITVDISNPDNITQRSERRGAAYDEGEKNIKGAVVLVTFVLGDRELVCLMIIREDGVTETLIPSTVDDAETRTIIGLGIRNALHLMHDEYPTVMSPHKGYAQVVFGGKKSPSNLWVVYYLLVRELYSYETSVTIFSGSSDADVVLAARRTARLLSGCVRSVTRHNDIGMRSIAMSRFNEYFDFDSLPQPQARTVDDKVMEQIQLIFASCEVPAAKWDWLRTMLQAKLSPSGSRADPDTPPPANLQNFFVSPGTKALRPVFWF